MHFSGANSNSGRQRQWLELKMKTVLLSLMAAGLMAVMPTYGVEQISYEIEAVYPHDPEAWTQGLFLQTGTLYESTGLHGQSSLRVVDLESGKVKRQILLDKTLFAEGLTLYNGKLYQLTWEAGLCLIYNPETFERIGEFRYQGEGWGLTHDDDGLIMSNGTAVISFLDSETHQVKRSITVTRQGRPVSDLNELEYVEGAIYANIWYSDEVIKIDPQSGVVVGVIDFSNLWKDSTRDEDQVLNGIAYDAKTQCFLITGKFWPKLFVIRLKNS